MVLTAKRLHAKKKTRCNFSLIILPFSFSFFLSFSLPPLSSASSPPYSFFILLLLRSRARHFDGGSQPRGPAARSRPAGRRRAVLLCGARNIRLQRGHCHRGVREPRPHHRLLHRGSRGLDETDADFGVLCVFFVIDALQGVCQGILRGTGACVRACVRARVCACARACVCARVCGMWRILCMRMYTCLCVSLSFVSDFWALIIHVCCYLACRMNEVVE